jgi:hypothetical protein
MTRGRPAANPLDLDPASAWVPRRVRPITRVVPWLVVVLALVQIGAQLPVIHDHGGATAGLYDEECSLERMGTAPGGAIVADVPDPGVPLLARPIAPVPGDPAPAVRPTLPPGSRAPPTA